MRPKEPLEMLKALSERLGSLVQSGPAADWRTEWEILQNDLVEWAKETFDGSSTDYRELRNALSSPVIIGPGVDPWRVLLRDADLLQRALVLVKHRIEQGQSELKAGSSHEHFIAAGTPHSAYVKLRDLVESATKHLFIVDPYVDRTIFDLLSNAKKGVSIRILTRQTNLPGDFVLEARKFKQQFAGTLDVRHGLSDLHDRFLVADDRLFYSGASFKDLGKKGSLVGEIQDVKAETLTHLESHWQQGTPLI